MLIFLIIFSLFKHRDYPIVFLAIFVNSKALNGFFNKIQNLDYPKRRIHLLFYDAVSNLLHNLKITFYFFLAVCYRIITKKLGNSLRRMGAITTPPRYSMDCGIRQQSSMKNPLEIGICNSTQHFL